MNVTALTRSEEYLTPEEKRTLDQPAEAPYLASIQVVKSLKKLNPAARRKVVDSILKELAKDEFLPVLNQWYESR